jgi:coiled-coil domain-containing protein 39
MADPAADVDRVATELVASGWDDDNNSGSEQVSSWRKQFGSGGLSAEPEEHETDEADEGAASAGGAYTWKRSDGRPQRGILSDGDDGGDDEDSEEGDTARGVTASGGGRAIPSGIDDLPLFADDKNKSLHRKIRAKEKRFVEVKAEIVETTSRVEIMSEHLKNVKQELLHTQELHGAKQKEVASEEHMKQLAEREIGRVAQEMRRFDAECSELEAKLNTVQQFLFKGNEEMDKFKLQMNWNQDEMEQWAMAARQKEEDALALERYRRADEAKIKELSLEIEKLTKTLQSHRRSGEDEATETQAKQIELDKTADEFRQLHAERQQLVKQWQDTIETMQRRDAEIAAASEQYAAARHGLQQKKDGLLDQKNRLRLQEQENKDAQQTISAKERQQSKVQQEMQLVTARLHEFKDQVEILKNQLASAVTQLNQQRTSNAHKSDHLDNMKHELETARARYKATQNALEACLNSTADAETLAKEAEADLTAMETELKRMDKDLALQKELMFRKSQALFGLRQREAALIAEISGARAASQNLRTKIKVLEQNALRQQELVYNGEFQIQQMERKVARASGERSADETKVLQAQIQVLQMELDRVRAEESMLTTQCKKLDDEKRAQDRVKRALLKEKESVEARIADVELANESLHSSLRQTLKEKEDLLVQHDLQSLEVKRLKELLNMRADEVMSLENRDFQLKKSMEERKKEIAMHREIQRATLRAIEDERHKVSVELAERENRVKKLQAKFETICKLTGYGSDDVPPGEERSQAYFVIKAAQHREELQREGDELDDKIRVAEKEVRALKKALDHLDDRNSEYRKSFHRADLSSGDAVKMSTLEEQVKSAEDTFFKRKKELTRIEMELDSESQRLKEVETQRQFARDNAQQLATALQHVEKEVLAERAKWGKVVKKLERQVRDHAKTVGSVGSGPSREQVQLDTYNLKEITNSLLYTLGQLANEFPEISDTLSVAVKESGLHIPAMPPGRIAAARTGQAADYGLPRPMSARSDKRYARVREGSFGFWVSLETDWRACLTGLVIDQSRAPAATARSAAQAVRAVAHAWQRPSRTFVLVSRIEYETLFFPVY